MSKNIITSWEHYKYEYSKSVIVNYDVHYKAMRTELRELLLSNKYEGERLTESTYLIKKLKKNDLESLERSILISFEKNKQKKMNEDANESEIKRVRIVFLLPNNDVFLEKVVIDEEVKS